MKRILLIVLAISVGYQAQAELFSPSSLTGGAIGAVAGAIIGHNNGRHGGEGALIGAGVGLLAGSVVDDRNRYHGHTSGYYSSPGYGHVSLGVGYSSSRYYPSHRYYHGYNRHNHWGPSFSVGYGYSYRPSYYARRYYAPVYSTPVYTQPVVVQQPVVQQAAPAPAPALQQVTIINNYYGSSTPMSSANAMFGR